MLPANLQLGKQQLMPQIIGSLPPMRGAWVEFQSLGFSFGPNLHYWDYFGDKPVTESAQNGFRSLSLSLFLFKQINTNSKKGAGIGLAVK